MSILPFKKRRPKPTSVLLNTVQAATLEIASRFLRSQSFSHAATKGTERELPIQDFFQNNLPGRYEVVKGEVVDLEETQSPQLDVMIFDGQKNFAFYLEENCILPAEALLVSIEVKSVLNKQELERSYKSALKLKSLRPFLREIAYRRERGEDTEGKCRYFHCIFAYNTDITQEDWIDKEYLRITEVSDEMGIPPSVIDRIYVANRGLIIPEEHIGIIEGKHTGEALICLYIHVYNFLERENKRRPPVPFIDYAGKLTSGWINLETK